MNEKNIIARITNDFYELTRLPMGDTASYDYLMSLSYSICNMIKLLHKDAGLYLLEYIAEEVEAHDNLVKTTVTRKGENAFDEVAYRTKFVAGLNNDLKISICETMGDILVDYDILR